MESLLGMYFLKIKNKYKKKIKTLKPITIIRLDVPQFTLSLHF